ncbi:pectate lyase [Dysgonomonas sp. 511]|uniref:pectate lyase n=1 Tax=Dysgonomonas sp. 511 TaxID=2302930 RepID=UPI0013D508B8|nr:pectate lyase [Dysgonomonas sp. 511]NDV78202.1 polysaccharide lyase 10 [Dysgonomonas sp. 511]
MKRHLLLILSVAFTLLSFAQKNRTEQNVRDAMKRATTFMMDNVSRQGGFLWNYLPDFSRTWGELEAYPTSVWVQSPGTPAIGNILLDAYHATGDEYYYQMAEKVANILVFGQLDCGGWNYLFDLAGESSLKKWYATIGKNAWGCGEFNHYYGNATFDDSVTSDAANFIMRMYMEKLDPRYKPSLDKAVGFILESQFSIGGWPQRYPLMYDYPGKNGEPDYTSCITLNDDVIDDNIEFLLRCYHVLGDARAYDALIRAMNCVRILQQGYPTAGWADQYTLDMKPASAREFEPAAITTSGTVNCIRNLLQYYQMTGDSKFLAGIPDALDFLQSIALGQADIAKAGKKVGEGQVLCPRFLVPGTHTPLYIHRKGTHVNNGSYYFDQNLENVIGHYASVVVVNIGKLRKEYETIKSTPVEEIKKKSSFMNPRDNKLPAYYSGDLSKVDKQRAEELLASLNSAGYWPAPLTYISNPYIGEGKNDDPAPTSYRETLYGKYNTAIYQPEEPVVGISCKAYIKNMFDLISFLKGN